MKRIISFIGFVTLLAVPVMAQSPTTTKVRLTERSNSLTGFKSKEKINTTTYKIGVRKPFRNKIVFAKVTPVEGSEKK